MATSAIIKASKSRPPTDTPTAMPVTFVPDDGSLAAADIFIVVDVVCFLWPKSVV